MELGGKLPHDGVAKTSKPIIALLNHGPRFPDVLVIISAYNFGGPKLAVGYIALDLPVRTS